MPIDLIGALVGWLVQAVGDHGIRLVRGSPDERALRRAVRDALGAVVDQADVSSREALRSGLRQCFSSPPRLLVDLSSPIGESLRAAITAQVAELDQMVNAETGQSFYEDVSVERDWLMGQTADAIIAALRSVVAQGSIAELVHALNASDMSAQVNALSRQLIQLTPAAAATRTLPRDIPSYTGRQSDLDRLMQAVAIPAALGGVVEVHAIDGMAGVGKTAFAIHAAHRLAARFPDGQIFLPLHAHTPGQQPVEPSEALATLLLTVGVRAEQIPTGAEERSALWRHYLADKRMLLLLDDAAGSEQVLPLLPAAERCLVLVTSRRRLTVLDAGVSISLDTLPPSEAAELFVRLARRSHLKITDSKVSEAVRLCGYLPLALRLAAGQLSRHSAWEVSDLITALTAEHNRPETIRAENVTVAAAFDLSYRHLDTRQRKLFRRLGLQFGIDIDDYAAAALNDTGLHTTRRLLDDLYNYHLIDEPAVGRYRFHDLMSEYAQTAAATERPVERNAAVKQLLDYYLYTAVAAGRELAWNTPDTLPPTNEEPAYAPELRTRKDKVSWLETERANLHAATEYAVRRGLYIYAIGIPFAIHGFLRTNGHWNQALSLHRAALITAQHTNDQPGQASALCQLGAVQRLIGDYLASNASQIRALELYRELGDRSGEADALTELGMVSWLIDEYSAATTALSEALELYKELRQSPGEADALCQLGVVQRLTGDYRTALTSLTQALELYRQIDDLLGEADSLRNLGAVQHLTGDYRTATSSLSQALELYRDLGSRPGQADALRNLGVVQHLTEDYQAALISLGQALELYRDLGDPHGETEALNDLGELLSDLSEEPAARAHHESALSTARIINVPLEEARALEGIGRCYLRAGQSGPGTEHLRKALIIYRAIRSPNASRVERVLAEG